MERRRVRRTWLFLGAGVGIGLALVWAPAALKSPASARRGAEPSASQTEAEGVRLEAAAKRPVPAPPKPSEPCAPFQVSVHVGWTGPLEGAEVRAVDADGVAHTSSSDEKGIARFEGLPCGEVGLTANAQGYAVYEPVTLSLPPRYPPTLHEFRLEEAASLRGRVVEAGSERPVADAKVTVSAGGALFMNPFPPQRMENTFEVLRTGSDGSFRAERVARSPIGALRIVEVEAPGYRHVWKVSPSDGEDEDFVIRMVPGGVLSGRVLDPEGRPVAGARLYAALDADGRHDPSLDPKAIDLPDRYTDHMMWFEQRPYPDETEDVYATLSTVSDTLGRFELTGLGLGEFYSLVASAPGWASSTVEGRIRATAPSRRTERDVRLRAPCTLEVRCLGKGGEPRAGEEVWLEHSPGWGLEIGRATAGRDGVARFSGLLPGSYHVGNIERGPARGTPGHADVEVSDATTKVDLEIPGPPPAPTETQVPLQSDDRAPIQREAEARPNTHNLFARLTVPAGVAPPRSYSLYAETSRSSTSSGGPWTTGADAGGPVALTLDPGHYRLTFEAAGFLPLRREADVPGTGKTDLGTLILEPGLSLAVRLLLPDGSPLRHASVHVASPARERDFMQTWLVRWLDAEPDQGVEREADTDAEGVARFVGLPHEPVSVWVLDRRCAPFQSRVALPAEAQPVVLHLGAGGLFVVRLVDAEGNPAPRQRLELWRLEEGAEPRWLEHEFSDVEGLCRARIGPGTHRLTFRSPPQESVVVVEAALEEGERREVRFQVP